MGSSAVVEKRSAAMKLITLVMVVTAVFGLCLAGLAAGFLVRGRRLNTCGCGRGHRHGPETDCDGCADAEPSNRVDDIL